MIPSRASALGFLISLVSFTSAALVNRTIDDGEGLIRFKDWLPGSVCDACRDSQPDPSLAFNATWHEAWNDPDVEDWIPSMTIKFSGTAVYVYNVLASYPYNATGGAKTVTYLTFELDGHAVGEFLSEGDTDVRYGASVYANSSIPDEAHTLVIRVPAGGPGRELSRVFFDYVEYTVVDDTIPDSSTSTAPPTTETETATQESPTLAAPKPTASDPPSSAESSTSSSATSSASAAEASHSESHARTGTIVGGAFGAVSAIAIAGIVMCRRRRRSRIQRLRNESTSPLPFAADVTSSASSLAEEQHITPAPQIKPLPAAPAIDLEEEDAVVAHSGPSYFEPILATSTLESVEAQRHVRPPQRLVPNRVAILLAGAIAFFFIRRRTARDVPASPTSNFRYRGNAASSGALLGYHAPHSPDVSPPTSGTTQSSLSLPRAGEIPIHLPTRLVPNRAGAIQDLSSPTSDEDAHGRPSGEMSRGHTDDEEHLRTQVAMLQQQMSRIQELVEMPPEYASDPPSRGSYTSVSAGGRA